MKWYDYDDDDLPEWFGFDYLDPPAYEGVFMGFDACADYAINRAESDPEQAAEVLRLVAAYLRRGEALPENLARYLADAIEASMSEPKARRAGALCEKLHLKARNRRPSAYWEDVGRYVSDWIGFGINPTDAQNRAAVTFDISEKTAGRYYKQYTEAMEKEAAEEAEWQANFARTNPEEARREAAEIEEAARKSKASQKPPPL